MADNFPAQCRHRVIETLREVYENDALARKNEMSAAERVRAHQTESGPLMTNLETWMKGELAEHKVERGHRLHAQTLVGADSLPA